MDNKSERYIMMSEALNEREQDILQLMSDGLTNREIASQLFLAFETVRWYAKQIYTKLGVRNRTHAVMYAQKLGLLNRNSTSPALTNLPAQSTSFVGRAKEIRDIEQLLNNVRLLTLTGPGGIGKTRLSIKVARDMIPTFRDGVYIVDLSVVKKTEHVVKTIAQVLGIGEVVGEEQFKTLQRALSKRELLLLIDNFEHLMDAVEVISTLLQSSPMLKIIVTSRECLRLKGEQEYPIPSLSISTTDADLEQLAESDAITLFVRRSQLVNPAFKLTPQNRHDIVEICRQLDGLPLAIELASAQSKILSPHDILKRLGGNRLDLLTNGQRDLPIRHQTLRQTIGWSYEQLCDDAKRLFYRLAVFRGGWTMDAAVAICGIDKPQRILKYLRTLVDKSLVYSKYNTNGDIRFNMLETIHEFAREQLDLSDETEQIYQYMTNYYVTMAEQAETELRLANQQHWFQCLDSEHENIRTVLEWCIQQQEAEKSVRLMSALRDFWFYQGFHSEGQEWLALLTPLLDEISPTLRARALLVQGLLAYARQQDATPFHQHALDIFKQLGDTHHTAWALTFLAFALESLPHRYDEATKYGEEGLALLRQTNEMPGIAWGLNVLGNLKRMSGSYLEAKTLYEECLTICLETGEQRRITMVLGNLGIIAEKLGQYDLARSFIRDSITLAYEIGFKYTIPAKLSLMAGVFAGMGLMKHATRLLSASLAINESMGVVAQANTQVEIDRYKANLHSQLGHKAFETFWSEGQVMSLDYAIEYALQDYV